MKQLASLLTVAALVLVATPALASGTSGGGAGISAPGSSERGFAVTERLNCKIIKVRENNTVVMVDLDTKAERVVQLTEKIKITAQDKKEFEGRKKLRMNDLAEGQNVQVTYRPDDMQIVKIKVLRSQSA